MRRSIDPTYAHANLVRGSKKQQVRSDLINVIALMEELIGRYSRDARAPYFAHRAIVAAREAPRFAVSYRIIMTIAGAIYT